ncbi:hypothetical protein Hanom_Chr05g00386161 [Helianthus anomalus]
MEQMVQQQQQELARKQAWEENEERLRIEQNIKQDRRWGAMYIANELAINNAKVLHEQERNQRDWEASLPYAEHSGWTDYSNLFVPRGPSDPSPHWPRGSGV